MNDNIVKTWINRALCNSNSCIGYKLSFYRHTYGLYLTDSIKQASKRICTKMLTIDEKLLVNNMWS